MTNINLINWEPLDMANQDHVKLILYLNHRSKKLTNEKALMKACIELKLQKELSEYLEKVKAIEDVKNQYNAWECKLKTKELKAQLVMCCVWVIKGYSEKNIKSLPSRDSYYEMDRKKFEDREGKKKMR